MSFQTHPTQSFSLSDNTAYRSRALTKFTKFTAFSKHFTAITALKQQAFIFDYTPGPAELHTKQYRLSKSKFLVQNSLVIQLYSNLAFGTKVVLHTTCIWQHGSTAAAAATTTGGSPVTWPHCRGTEGLQVRHGMSHGSIP